MSDLRLIVNGRRYGGWKSVRVTRSLECVAGSFELRVSDRWGGQSEPWPIVEEDACRVEIDGESVIDGFVDRRSIALAGDSRDLTLSGRDQCAALVDCSADLKKWTFRDATVLDIARKVVAPFGIKVSLQAGLAIPKAPKKLAVSPGDSAFDVIAAAAKRTGVLVVSDGAGGLLVTRAGSARATPLVLGANILAAAADFDATDRFSRYDVVTQVGGTDEASGGATRVRGRASDPAVRRQARVLLVRPEAGVTADYARKRADWEARIRAARADSVTIVVVGWKQPSGALWPLNALSRVKADQIGIDGDMLISQVEFSISDAGEATQLRLVRPDAYTPEPEAIVRTAGGAYKKIRDGATLPVYPVSTFGDGG